MVPRATGWSAVRLGPMDGTRLILVRHGESCAQADGFVGGHDGCRGLSDRGRRQAEALAERWRRTDEIGQVDAMYTSLMPRAAETAEIIAPAIGSPDIDVDCDVCEHHPGEGDGLPWDEFNQRYPLPESGWSRDLRRDPGGETFEEMQARVHRALDNYIERHTGQTILIACHGGVIVHTAWRLLGIDGWKSGPDGHRAWFNPANASITEWEFGSLPWAPHVRGWRMVRFNDHAHLLDPDAPELAP